MANGRASYTSYDYEPCTVVPVIASFDAEGHIRPLYVRVNGLSLKVTSYWIKCDFVNYTRFNCQVSDGDTTRPVTLDYVHDNTLWTMKL